MQADYEPCRKPSPKCDHAGSLILGFPASRIVRNKCLLFINYLVNSILSQPLQKTKIILKRKIHLVNKKEKIKLRKIRRYTSTFPSTKHKASLVAQTVKHLPTMWETRVQSLGREDPLEKEMATHSSTLAWKIPWTEEPGRLQSMGLQRVGHD